MVNLPKATTKRQNQESHELTDSKVQTPQQRRANEAFAKKQETKRGKNEPVVKKAVVQKSPVSKFWLCMCLRTPLPYSLLTHLKRSEKG
jgi:hypothetical protein